VTPTPEQEARQRIDAYLVEAGWVVQDRSELNLQAGPGVAVREFPMAPGHGYADYLLFVDSKAVGVLEAKPVGHHLGGVEMQVDKYATGLPATRPVPRRSTFIPRISCPQQCRESSTKPQPQRSEMCLATGLLSQTLLTSTRFGYSYCLVQPRSFVSQGTIRVLQHRANPMLSESHCAQLLPSAKSADWPI